MNADPAVALILDVMMGGVALAMAAAGLRLLRGPTNADRVMALDVLTISAVAEVALLAWRTDVTALLDVAVAVAMVTFMGAVALSWYLERKGEP
ncbi:MAG: monovalent cation/H+ antiporter complex subunit F [Myxococcota bacterium]|nr:monovalent cation/H+ antiporter complex subunit F [Myxococcota bacterium]